MRIGVREFRITAVGETAWHKMSDIGHVVFGLTGGEATERPGEICLEAADPATVMQAVSPGVVLEILSAG